jgi:hypothetical protein
MVSQLDSPRTSYKKEMNLGSLNDETGKVCLKIIHAVKAVPGKRKA